jgi:hypothetical protein
LGRVEGDELDGANDDANSKVTPSIVAIPLSRDQKPFRLDERDRVKQRGATIMSMGQMLGEEEMHDDWGDVAVGDEVDISGDVCSYRVC